MPMTPAINMQSAAIERELTRLRKKWDSFRANEPEGGGSPGEWIAERIGELEHEQQQRMRGVLPRTDVPPQSR